MTPTPASHSIPLLELRAGDRLVGWIQGDLVRFRGFATQRDAARAAAVAHRALLRRLARGHRATESVMETDLDLVRRRTDRAPASANGRSVASVLRSAIDGRGAGGAEFSFEVRVPPPIDELRMRGMAYVMYRALLSSGTAWPLVRPEAALEALTARATRTAKAESTNGVTSGAFGRLRRLLGRTSRGWGLPHAGTRQDEPIPVSAG
jgi:hypothetical protein